MTASVTGDWFLDNLRMSGYDRFGLFWFALVKFGFSDLICSKTCCRPVMVSLWLGLWMWWINLFQFGFVWFCLFTFSRSIFFQGFWPRGGFLMTGVMTGGAAWAATGIRIWFGSINLCLYCLQVQHLFETYLMWLWLMRLATQNQLMMSIGQS